MNQPRPDTTQELFELKYRLDRIIEQCELARAIAFDHPAPLDFSDDNVLPEVFE